MSDVSPSPFFTDCCPAEGVFPMVAQKNVIGFHCSLLFWQPLASLKQKRVGLCRIFGLFGPHCRKKRISVLQFPALLCAPLTTIRPKSVEPWRVMSSESVFFPNFCQNTYAPLSISSHHQIDEGYEGKMALFWQNCPKNAYISFNSLIASVKTLCRMCCALPKHAFFYAQRNCECRVCSVCVGCVPCALRAQCAL
jgi:hypothetical protein